MSAASRARWWSRHGRRAAGIALVSASVLTTAVFAFIANDRPTDGAEAALFVIIAAALQLGGAMAFSHEGRADPTHAQASFRALARLARRTAAARELADQASGSGAAQLRPTVLRLSVELAWIEDGLVGAGEHWAAVHPDLQDEALQDEGHEPEEHDQ